MPASPLYTEILHRMARQGYRPTDAILDGMGASQADFEAIWALEHPGQVRPPVEVHGETLRELAETLTGREHRRVSGALFTLTQVAFGKEDAALPDAQVLPLEAALMRARDLGMSDGGERGSEVLDAAIRRIRKRAGRLRLAHPELAADEEG